MNRTVKLVLWIICLTLAAFIWQSLARRERNLDNIQRVKPGMTRAMVNFIMEGDGEVWMSPYDSTVYHSYNAPLLLFENIFVVYNSTDRVTLISR